MAKKPSLGRQKIKIARIEKPNHRQVTFSKRRSGLFKKACELCTLCGVEVVIIVFSPANKVFSFGHPDVDSLVDRFYISRGLHNNQIVVSNVNTWAASSSANTSVRELNAQLTHITTLLDAEKERKEALEMAAAAGRGQYWWEAPIEKLGRGELEQLASSLEELKKSVILQAKVMNETTSSSSNPMAGVRMVDNRFDAGKHKMVSDQEMGASSSGAGFPPGFDNGFGNFGGQHNGFGGF